MKYLKDFIHSFIVSSENEKELPNKVIEILKKVEENDKKINNIKKCLQEVKNE
jgi:hypothetical protein